MSRKKTCKGICALLAAAVFLTFCGGCAKEEEELLPWEWAASINKVEINQVTPWNAERELTPLADSELDTLISMLNALRASDFLENETESGAAPAFGMTINCDDGIITLTESIASDQGVDLHIGDKVWWVNSAALRDFIVFITDADSAGAENSGASAAEKLADGEFAPLQFISEMFDQSGAIRITLTAFGEEQASYLLSELWYAERYGMALDGFTWAPADSGDVPTGGAAEYELELRSEDGSYALRLFAGSNIVLINGTAAFAATQEGGKAADVAAAIRSEYDSTEISFEDVAFESEETDPEMLARLAVAAYGGKLLSASPGSVYEITGFELLDGGVLFDDPESGNMVGFWCKLAVKPVVYDGGWMIGNAEDGTGEYEGWLTTYREIRIDRDESGVWHITDMGTGGLSPD